MATRYIKVCDGCGAEHTLEDSPFSGMTLPPDWIRVGENEIACSWACVIAIAKNHGGEHPLDAYGRPSSQPSRGTPSPEPQTTEAPLDSEGAYHPAEPVKPRRTRKKGAA